MKKTRTFLLVLASASALLILPSNSGDSKQAAKARPAEVPVSKELLAKAHSEVNARVLEHLNPQESLADRFSRRMVPRSQYYRAEFATTSKDSKRAQFKIVHHKGIARKPGEGQVVAFGFYESETGGVFLYDVKSGRHVRAGVHPLIAGRTETL